MEIWYDERKNIYGAPGFRLRLVRWGDAHTGATVITRGFVTSSGWVDGKVTQEIIQPDVSKSDAIRMAIARFDELVKEHECNPC